MKRSWNLPVDRGRMNATELAKLEKDGLEVIHDIDRFARQGLQSLTAADYDRLKWLGVYAQRPKEDGYFMLRVKIPGGKLTAEQAEIIADISKSYARNTIDVTTRQCVQFHWLTIESLPVVLKSLEKAGLTTLEAAGDCPRNIIGNPLAGIDPDEFIDTSSILAELNTFFHNNTDFSNLPRKFKIGISGSPDNAIKAEINDLAFVPAVKESAGQHITGFAVLAAGGLSHQPLLATRLSIFVRPEEVVKVAAAVATIFRDFGYREKRNHARLKFLFADWGKARFTEELLKLTGPLLSGGKAIKNDWDASRIYGINPQKQPGLYYWGLTVPGGIISPDDLESVARIAKRYGDGSVRTTNTQDLLIPNIGERHLAAVKGEELYVRSAHLRQAAIAKIVACPGKEFCPFALAVTKGRIPEIASAIDEEFGPNVPIRIHLSGCGNTCGQSQIADIGLQGAAISANGQLQEAFEFWIGGRLGENARLAEKLPGKVEAAHIKEVIINIIKDYMIKKYSNETFGEYVDRKGAPDLSSLAGCLKGGR